MPMRWIYSCLVIMVACRAATPNQSAASTYDAVIAGTSCTNETVTSTAQRTCTYRVGDDLEFVIAGVGNRDAGMTVLRVNGYAGDYYATMGAGGTHGCIIVKPGEGRPAGHGTDPWDLAFVSPVNGQVYHTWQECPSP
jgi:hypothetical protein